jgi:RNA polymerase sigma-70 factor, ECF subfamily
MPAQVMTRSERMSARHEPDASDRALGHLVEHCGERAVRIARDLLGDPAAAEDAVQEALAAAIGGLGRLRDPAALEGWFYRVLTNHCMRALRRRRWLAVWTRARASDPEAELAPGPAPDAALAAARQRARLLLAVGGLPPMQKAAVVLRYGHDLPVDQIGSLLGVSPKTVKTHLVRGLRALRGALGEER